MRFLAYAAALSGLPLLLCVACKTGGSHPTSQVKDDAPLSASATPDPAAPLPLDPSPRDGEPAMAKVVAAIKGGNRQQAADLLFNPNDFYNIPALPPGTDPAVLASLTLQNDFFAAHPETLHTFWVPWMLDRLTPVGIDAFLQNAKTRAAAAEQTIRQQVALNGMGALPSFATRGIAASTTGHPTFAEAQSNGFFGPNGGNFYVYAWDHPYQSIDAFFGYLLSSLASNVQYANGDDPLLLLARVDAAYPIPSGGGNDGISCTYPFTQDAGRLQLYLDNLDVGCVSRNTSSAYLSASCPALGVVPPDHVMTVLRLKDGGAYINLQTLTSSTQSELKSNWNFAIAYGAYASVVEVLAHSLSTETRHPQPAADCRDRAKGGGGGGAIAFGATPDRAAWGASN